MGPATAAKGQPAERTTGEANEVSGPPVIELLRRFTPKFMVWEQPVAQIKSVLSKILLCRTSILRGHVYKCTGCQSEINVYNSCTDRNCPQCGGGRRADWMDKSTEVILPGVPYFQVIFTLPDKLSSLILGNRKELYSLLFLSAWKALSGELRRTAKYEPAALMVLHTWNQQLEHHPHIHALVPGAGPAIDGDQWNVARHPKHRRRAKPYLTDNVELGRKYREHFVRSLRRLIRQGKMKIGGSVEFLNDPVEREEWFRKLASTDWNVFIEGPPKGKSDPANVVKYLASYLTGGPIADGRIIEANDDEVTFWARPKKSSTESKEHRGMHRPRPYRLNGRQFMQRWTLHVLPKGFTRSRCYGGYHGNKKEAYLLRCRELLDIASEPSSETTLPEEKEEIERLCPHCEIPMTCLASRRRPSWRQIFERDIYLTLQYNPVHHIYSRSRSPPS